MTMTATAQTAQITDDERARRRVARDRLKAEVKKPGTRGHRAAVLYMMISHARGKLHCRSYRRFHGGWRSEHVAWEPKMTDRPERFESEDFQRYVKRLGSGCDERWARYLYVKSAIESLDDQRAFLTQFLTEDKLRVKSFEQAVAAGREPYSWQKPLFDDALREICERVIAG